MSTILTEERRTEIDRAVRDVREGGILAQDVTLEERYEPREHYVLVTVTLPQPKGETWPSEEFYSFRRRIRDAVTDRVGADVSLQLTFTSLDDSSASERGEREGDGPATTSKQATTETG